MLFKMKLMSAAQVLKIAGGGYGVTHEVARARIIELVGYCPEGAPESGTWESILDWLGLEEGEG